MSYRKERSESYIVSLITYVRERSEACHAKECKSSPMNASCRM